MDKDISEDSVTLRYIYAVDGGDGSEEIDAVNGVSLSSKRMPP